MFSKLTVLGMACGLLVAGVAAAGPIISPTGAVVDSGGTFPDPDNDIVNTHNQNGLLTGFTSGVTDYDTYLAGNPLHTPIFADNEWFSLVSPTFPVIVTYDLGAVITINALALWNEESAGIASFNLETSTDGVSFAALVSGLIPTDHTVIGLPDYPADNFSFAATAARFVRFIITAAPQPDGTFPGASIGEVAFRSTQGDQPPPNGEVPEPASMILFGITALGMGLVARRRVKQSAQEDSSVC